MERVLPGMLSGSTLWTLPSEVQQMWTKKIHATKNGSESQKQVVINESDMTEIKLEMRYN